MAGMLPMAVFGLEVPCGDVAIQGIGSVRSAFRITMAAIDPSAAPEDDGPPRATLKIIRQPIFDDDEDDEYDSDEFDADEFEREMLEGDDDEDDEDDEDDDEDDEAVNGGPSDPAKSKKARKAAAEKAIAKLLAEEGEMELDVDELTNGVNGTKKSPKAKGKLPADEDEEDDDDDISDIEDDEDFIEEFVICTLDPEKHYQQPLDITIGEDERVFFKVSGTHSVFLTGNYVAPIDEEDDYDEDDEDDELDYDLEPDSDELELEEDDEDELDDLEDPRITELDEDDEEVPELIQAAIKKAAKKGNKRPADDDTELSVTLDDMISKSKAGEEDAKVSKKQLKKQKKNDGTAATTATEAAAKSDKKVQFAKNLEQGPTPTKDTKVGAQDKTAKATLGVKTVQGVKIDDKKIGTGPAAKSGDRVGMRYIGKLEKDGKVFDSNKKGKPFSFKLGAGEVIKGWDIGIAGMSIGGERRITIPPHLGYGAKGTAGIPGNSTLVFDVKLLENKGK